MLTNAGKTKQYVRIIGALCENLLVLLLDVRESLVKRSECPALAAMLFSSSDTSPRQKSPVT